MSVLVYASMSASTRATNLLHELLQRAWLARLPAGWGRIRGHGRNDNGCVAVLWQKDDGVVVTVVTKRDVSALAVAITGDGIDRTVETCGT